MKTAEFLDLIERWGVMPPMQVENLRKQVGTSEYPVHPVLLARRLIEEGYINSYFAKTLLAGGPPGGEFTAGGSDDSPASDDYGLEPLPEESSWADEDEDLAGYRLDDLELPPIEGSDWLTREADVQSAGTLPTLGTGKILEQSSPSPLAAWLEEQGLSGLPWWVIALAACGALTFVIIIVILIVW